MESYQAHNLNIKVRFLSLLMNENLINIIIIIGLFVIFLEYKLWKNNIINFIIIFSLVFIVNYTNIFNIHLFNLNSWKLLFLFLITISLLIILNIIKEKSFDIYCLLILSYIGSLILILSDNLMTLYLGLELQTFSIFILIAKNRVSIKSSEAGLKYFMLGAISSGFYLLSLVILFLFGFSLNFNEILLLNNDLIIIICISLIILSLSFKLSLFPFHFWIPDIYEGSSWDILSLIATLPKISVISVLIQILINSNIIITISLLSIVIGTLGALNQTKFKRLLAYSGISHMGFIILSYFLLSKFNLIVGNIYLIIYMLTMLSLFIIILNNNISFNYIIELGGLKFINKILAITLILIILSIAGIPPLSGFISKWYLLWIIIENNYNFSAFIIILFSIIGIAYYLRLVKIIYFQKKGSYFLWKDILDNKTFIKKDFSFFLLGFIFFIVLFLIFNFNFIINFLSYIFISLY